MRRTDREVTDPNIIRDIIAACQCCRLGFCDRGEVYILPLHFGFIEQNGSYVFYFHGANEGRKIQLIQQAPAVGFEMDTAMQIHEGRVACEYSASYQSVIGNGRVSFVTDGAEKRAGLCAIMRHITGKADWAFAEASLNAVTVFKLEVDKLSCKVHA